MTRKEELVDYYNNNLSVSQKLENRSISGEDLDKN